MSTPTVYRVINKSNNRVEHFRNPREVAAHLLGKRLSNLLLIKSDATGDRLVSITSSDVLEIEVALTAA
jgi:hypothetical protein